jgi:Protein of unknown function (DUF3093)
VTSSRVRSPSAAGYRETLWAPLSWWLGGLVFTVAVWWAFLVATSAALAWSAAAVTGGSVVVWLGRYGGLRLIVDSEGLRAGRATLPWRYVGAAAACDAAQTRHLLGTGADARAYLMVRPYIPGAVRVAVDDDRDPAPYWLISTRRPGVVAAHLNNGGVPD